MGHPSLGTDLRGLAELVGSVLLAFALLVVVLGVTLSLGAVTPSLSLSTGVGELVGGLALARGAGRTARAAGAGLFAAGLLAAGSTLFFG